MLDSNTRASEMQPFNLTEIVFDYDYDARGSVCQCSHTQSIKLKGITWNYANRYE